MDIKLTYPIQVNGVEVDTLKMRRAKLRDRLAVDKQLVSDGEKEVNLIANLCEVAPTDLDDIDMSDYKKLQDTLSDFLS